MQRYAAIINDPDSPFTGLRVVTNEDASAAYFAGLMQQYSVPGVVLVRPQERRGVTYLVAFDSKTWHVDADVLRAALREAWPAAEMQPPTPHIESDVRDVHWYYRAGGDVLEAYTHKDGTCLYLDGGISLVAKFAIWYRKLVPAGIDVIFCDDSYSFDGVITPDSTESDLIELTG